MSGLVLEGFFLDFCYMVLLTPLVTVLLVVMLTGSSLSYCDARNNLRRRRVSFLCFVQSAVSFSKVQRQTV